MDKVFLNDKIIIADRAGIPIDDSSFLYGIGLFETMRADAGRIFRLDDHLNRLIASAKALAIHNSYTPEQIKNAVGQVLEANALDDARLRLTLTNGPLSADDTPSSTLLVTAAPFIPYPAEYYDKGVRVIVTDFRQNAADPFTGHKTTSYGARLTALRRAHEKLAAEALWFTTENRLAEGSISNVFLVKDNTLLTPPVATPVLPGIARKTVLEIAEQETIKHEQRPLDINDLLTADEIFITNVIMTVLPVVAVEAHTVGEGVPGPLTRKILEKFRDRLKQ